MTTRRRLATAGVIVLALGLGAGAAVAASSAEPQLRSRLSGLVQPWNDRSFNQRLDTWRSAVRRAEHDPLGAGLGTEGTAGANSTTDNSYLKILVEQGFLGVALFLAGITLACISIGRRLRRLPRNSLPRILGAAALGAFCAFLVLLITGEYIEQPGKVIAWALLGVAFSQTMLAARAD